MARFLPPDDSSEDHPLPEHMRITAIWRRGPDGARNFQAGRSTEDDKERRIRNIYTIAHDGIEEEVDGVDSMASMLGISVKAFRARISHNGYPLVAGDITILSEVRE